MQFIIYQLVSSDFSIVTLTHTPIHHLIRNERDKALHQEDIGAWIRQWCCGD
jgi:hypothetical protein